MVVNIKADVTKALEKLNKVNKGIVALGRLTTENLGESGKWYAKTLVPVYTGRTYSLIKTFGPTRGRRQEVIIVAENPTEKDGHRRNIANFDLVRWMHTSVKALRHIRSGDPHFMYTTREYLNNIKTGVAKGNWQKIRIRI